jgi:hypothetical protein
MPLRFPGFFSSIKGGVKEPASGGKALVFKFPFTIGSGPNDDFRPKQKVWTPGHITLDEVDGKVQAFVAHDQADFVVDGETARSAELTAGAVHTFEVEGAFIAVRLGPDAKQWLKGGDKKGEPAPAKTGPDGESAETRAMQTVSRHHSAITRRPSGKSAHEFSHPPPEAARRVAPEPLPEHLRLHPEADAVPINAETGELLCPHCWLRFDLGDLKHVSVHEDLRGDSILGSNAQQRFHAVRFNGQGRALDAMGVPCNEIACPHCHHKLHSGFIDLPQAIYSIVGAPSAGKSYFIAIMLHQLRERLARKEDAVLKDADPTGNATLNGMMGQLFHARSSADAVLLKTQLEGEMYQRVMRHGHRVAMPKPFIFTLSRHDNSDAKSLVFYDNAGEHFEPGLDLNDSPGAQHVAFSEAIFFLFDPTSSVGFRQRLADHPDPQLALAERLDQQDVLLAELDARVRTLTGMTSQERLNKPLLFMIGKSDVWQSLVVEERGQWLQPYFSGEHLQRSAVLWNSTLLREFLQAICPTIVGIAESLSEEVVYFPVSSFGHSPITLEDGRLAPDLARLKPDNIEVPVLWALSRLPGWSHLVEDSSGE